MENNNESNNTNEKENGKFFKIMYKTRLKIRRGETTIINLSLLFSIISLLTAPWLVVLGLIVALVLGYKITIDRTGVGFEDTFNEVVQHGKQNVEKVFNDMSEE